MIRNAHLFALLALLAAGPLGAIEGPVAVSPGTADDEPTSADPCPTFSWSAAPQATGYEIAVYSTESAPGEPPTLRHRLPAGSTSWTPSLEACLPRGTSYAWTVRALGAVGDAWAEPLLFRVPTGPSAAELERALAVLTEWRETEERREQEAGTSAGALYGASASTLGTQGEATSVPRFNARAVETVGVAAAVASTPPLTPTYSLSLENDLGLGPDGAIFQDDKVVLHAPTGGNTGVGVEALESVVPNSTTNQGELNTALGERALKLAESGTANVAVGRSALEDLLTASGNVAIGAFALSGIDETAAPDGSASYGNVGVGSVTLEDLEYGQGNAAVGDAALSQLGSGVYEGGSRNTAVGSAAGNNLREGDDNLYLSSPGGDTVESNTIRLGNPSVHTQAFLAGQVAIGTTDSPANQLQVEEAIDDASVRPGSHVARIVNTATTDDDGPDVLALQMEIDDPGADANFITFFDASGDIGAIEGNGGGIALNSTSADFAEYLPKADPEAELAPGDVVGLFGAALSHRTEGADRILVVTTAPIVSGGDPGEGRRSEYGRVAFLGQVPVRVRGPVATGDYLIASGLEDGTASAVGEAGLRLDDLPRVIGRALTSTGKRAGVVRALVGLPGPTLSAHVRELERLRDHVAALRVRLAELETGRAR